MQTIDHEPWADTEPNWTDDGIEEMADFLDKPVDEVRQKLQKDAWLEQQSLETVLNYESDAVREIDHDTRLEHNVHVVLDFGDTPADMRFDDWTEWFLSVRRAIDEYTDYRITNKRQQLRDGEQTLVLTLAPESDA